jgi:exodeoxyribonuclease V alpha subunit
MFKTFNDINRQSREKLEFITGLVERVTYHNEENGFAVLKIKVRGRKDLIALIGMVPSVTVGEEVQA